MTPGLTAMASPLTGKDRPMSPFVDYLFSSPIGFPSLSSPFGGRHGPDVFALKDGALCLESLYGDAAEGAEHQEDGGLFASYDVLKGNGYPLVESPVADPGSRGTPLYKGRGRKRCYSAMAPLSESALAPLPPVPGDLASPSGLRLRSSDGVCGGLESSEHGADGGRSVAVPKDDDARVSRRVGAPAEADVEAELEAEAELHLEASVRCQRDEVARLEEAVRASEAELAAVNAERRDVWAAVAAIRTCVLAGAAALGLERGAAAAGARARGGLGGAGLPPLRLVEMHQGHVGAPTVGCSVSAGLHPSIAAGPHQGAGGGGGGNGASHHRAASSLLSAGNGAVSSVGSPCLGVGLDAAGFASLVAGGPPPPPAAMLSEARSRTAVAPLGGGADRSPRPRPPPLSLAHAAGEDPLAHAHAAPLAVAGGGNGGDDGLRTPRGGASRGPGSSAFERAMQGGGYRPSHQQHQHQHQQALEQHRLRQHAGLPSAHGASLPPPPSHHLHSQPIPSSRPTPGGSPAPAPVLESSSSGLLGTPTAASLGTPSSARDARHVGSLDDALAFDPASAALLGSIFSPVPDATVSAIGRHAAGLDMLESPIKHLDSPLIPAKGHRRLFADETAAARSIAAARASKMPLGAPTVQPHGLSFVPDGFFEDLV